MLLRIDGAAVVRREDSREDVVDDVVEVGPRDRVQSDGPVEVEIVESRTCEECEEERPLSDIIVNDRMVCSDCSEPEDRIVS